MSCCKCGKESYISIGGIGEFCADCHNEWVSEQYGISDDFEYPKQFEVYDAAIGKNRLFHLKHLNLVHCITWIAEEQPTGYEINHISYPGEHPVKVVKEFFEKIIAAVESKTFDSFGLAMKGNITIIWDRDNDCVGVRIDGKRISLEKFGEMLASYEGWQLQYRIMDASDCALKKDELLMPVKVGHDVLMEELERNISIMEDGNNFICYKDTLVFDTMFESIFDRLELMADYHDYTDEAIRTAKDMILRFENLETDDDYFPYNWIDLLNDFVKKNANDVC